MTRKEHDDFAKRLAEEKGSSGLDIEGLDHLWNVAGKYREMPIEVFEWCVRTGRRVRDAPNN